MKPLHQFWHLLKLQIFINPMLGLMIFMCLISRGTSEITWKYNALGWNQYPGGLSSFFGFYFLWFFLFSGSFGTNTSSIGNPLTGSSYLWTRAVDRRLILGVMMFIYWVCVAIIIQPGVTHLFLPMKPLQICFQSPDDNGAFQHALLSDHRLAAHQLYDQWKNIIIEVPRGREDQIGLLVFQNLTLALLLLWLGMGMRISGTWKKFIPWVIILPMLGSSFLNLFFVNRLGKGHYMPDQYGYGAQFVFYANYHIWLWIGLVIAAIVILRGVSRNFLNPS
jgi:hypothetical protein